MWEFLWATSPFFQGQAADNMCIMQSNNKPHTAGRQPQPRYTTGATSSIVTTACHTNPEVKLHPTSHLATAVDAIALPHANECAYGLLQSGLHQVVPEQARGAGVRQQIGVPLLQAMPGEAPVPLGRVCGA